MPPEKDFFIIAGILIAVIVLSIVISKLYPIRKESKKYDIIKLKMPKGYLEKYRRIAALKGMRLEQYIDKLINDDNLIK